MIRVLAALIVAVFAFPAWAQPAQTAFVVSSCGGQSFTVGQRQIATMDTAGNWCTNSSGGGAATSVSIIQSGSVVSSTNPLWVQSSSTIPVVVTVNAPPNDVTAGPTAFTGTGTLTVSTQGAGAVGVQATGNGGGLAFSFQANDDGTNWFSINCFTTAGAIVTSGTANGNWVCPVAGYKNVRINLTAITSGTETFTLNASAGSIQHILTTQGVAADIRSFGGTAVATGTGASGAGIPRVTVSNDSTVQPIPATTGGMSVFTKQVANNTTSFAVDASAGTLYGVSAFNNSATIAYLKLYNTAQGSVTCGTPTPVDRMLIPANTSGAGFIWHMPLGVAYGTAITACVTTGFADNDTTAPAASTYLVSFYYK